ncbi:DUF1620-domain-containing protein [Pseudovirgaria hyperparasitica]|uniref:ER membrane protein complex subunit 1 n=1 Tax=Pseudovirgaria hyperparasitica TaxID=470096 RepID=A0A6A6W4D4_9PEZI|nr:DUF1620-domain-containing protein [Pseudovirgaria hyperparasitica]KAF2757732.1 DUF1620-domain-containing protein [Pseudovirgaria hyperparasitica]
MRLQELLLLPAILIPTVQAIFADDAYHVDYHWALVGQPQQHATFFQQPFAGSKASLIYTLSAHNVLAAINPKDGSVVWRQLLTPSTNSSQTFLAAGEGQDTLISAVDGQVAAWSSSDGRMVWEKQLGTSRIKDAEIIDFEDGKQASTSKDAIVLMEGETPTVMRLNGATGKTKWQFADTSGDVPFQLSSSATSVYYIAHHGTFLGGYKIKVSSLSPVNGDKLDSYTLSSDSEVSSPESILFAGANTASPLLVWADKAHKVLKINIIGTKGVASFNIENKGSGEIERVTVHAPSRITSLPHFLVQYQTSLSQWAEVYHVDVNKGTISKAYDIPNMSGNGAFSTSTVDANVYFTRVTTEEMIIYSSASHGIVGRWNRKVLGASTEGDAYPLYGVTEAVVRSNTAQAVRSAILFSNGDWSLLRNGESLWTRPEALASTLSAVFTSYPEAETLAQQLDIEGHQNVVSAFIHRLMRHIDDLRHLPTWFQSLPTNLMASFGGATISPDSIKKDSFGFGKIVILATARNRLIALDTAAQGKVLWNVDVSSIAPGSKLTAPQLTSLPNGRVQITDPRLSTPIIVNALTGESNNLQSDIVTTVPTGQFSTVVEYTLKDGELQGHIFGRPDEVVWQFKPLDGERIHGIAARPLDDPVASIGKVLGDRRVLYKYLNANLVLVTGVSEITSTASVYLLDSVSGNVLYSASHRDVDTTRFIASTVSENWLAYSFTSASSSVGSRGHQLVIAELFESSLPNDRGPLAASGNFSSTDPSSTVGDISKPYAKSQTYHIPEEISHMSVTHTKQGISSRQILAVLPQSHAVVGIPRQIVDPRRPIGRDPTASEASEGLMKYAPNLEFDPKWYLNHKREVFGIKNVITTPSSLESTSLVFAYGLDVFGTRVAPSFTFDILGKDFNKPQMLLTVAALGVGVLVVAPLVKRKQINARWTT